MLYYRCYDNNNADLDSFILNNVESAYLDNFILNDIDSQLGQSNKASTFLQELSFIKKVCGAETGSGCRI